MAKATSSLHKRPVVKDVGKLKAGEICYFEVFEPILEEDGFTAKGERRFKVPLMKLETFEAVMPGLVRCAVLSRKGGYRAGQVLELASITSVVVPRGAHVSMWS